MDRYTSAYNILVKKYKGDTEKELAFKKVNLEKTIKLQETWLKQFDNFNEQLRQAATHKVSPNAGFFSYKRAKSKYSSSIENLKTAKAQGNISEEQYTAKMEEMNADWRSFRDQLWQDNVQAGMDILNNTFSVFEQIYQMQLDKLKQMHEEEINSLKKKEEIAVKLAGSSARRQFQARMVYEEKIKKSNEQYEQDRKEALKKQQAMQIAQSIMNTASAIMQVWSAFAMVPPLAIALSASIATLGAIQIAKIKQQKFAEGTANRYVADYAQQGSTTDLIPAKLSPKEMVLSAKTVEEVGGPMSVDQALTNAKSMNSSSNGMVVLQVENFVGTEEFALQTATMINDLTTRGAF